ncbi:MAG: putative aminopeptidase YsdC [Phycisphaerae bacterium]|nr:putative aminopeptidase YsdC [Phycisphaerae bacterium]
MDFLRKLVETPGVPGREERIRQVIHDEVAGLFDTIQTDAMGNLICTREPRGKAPDGGSSGEHHKTVAMHAHHEHPTTVLLCCHMDEIGFIVSHVDESTGYLRVMNLGGFDARTLLARRVLVQAEDGDLLGVMNAAKPIHIMSDEEKKRIPEIPDVYVDLMMEPRKVRKKVRVGDPVTLWQPLAEIGDCCVCKAMDNRIATWVAVNAVRKLEGKSHSCRIVYVAAAQEEVGLRGASAVVHAVKPDIGIAIDVTIAADTPGVEGARQVTRLGEGVALKVMDSASITHRGLLDEWIAIARKKKIKHQLEVLPRGGTDAGAIQRAAGSVKTGTISVPCRYVHTVTETVHRKDLKAAVDLLAAYLQQA